MKTKILALFILLVTIITSCNYSKPNKDGQSFSPRNGLNLNSIIRVDDIPTDSIVVNFKEKNISCYYKGNVAYMTKLAEIGMTTMDKRK